MSNTTVGDLADSPRAARVRAEDGFGAIVRELIAKSDVRFVDVARSLGVRREDLYETMDGSKHFRAAWLSLLPPTVELAYLKMRAAHHACDLAPIGDAEEAQAHPNRVVASLSRVIGNIANRFQAQFISPDQASADLRDIREARRALADLEAHLEEVVAQRGMRVAP